MSTGRGKMRTLMLGMLMILMVSGEDVVTVNVEGFKGEDVILPCTCLNRDLNMEFKWQAEGTTYVRVVNHTGNISDFSDNYNGRATLFVSANSSNCSLLLNNITPEDERKYKCSFKDGGGLYNYSYVNLTVFPINVPRYALSIQIKDLKVYQCDVKTLDQHTEIEWSVDGQDPEYSSLTNISTTNTLDAHTGIYHFTSKLTTKLNLTSEPKCVPKPKNFSPHNIQTWHRLMPFALVAALVAALVVLSLFYKRKVSRKLNVGEEKRELRIFV